MTQFRFAYLFASILALAGCSVIPGEAYFDRGSPESLLDVSSEVVNFDVTSDASSDEIAQWANQNQPTRAELYCLEGQRSCAQARDTLEQFGIPVKYVSAADNKATLVYERVVARDCENRYIDNSINPYNLNHPTFGCSIASNMVQMVSDKNQFVSPALLDYHDAEKSAQVYKVYMTPPKVVDFSLKDSLVGSAKSQ